MEKIAREIGFVVQDGKTYKFKVKESSNEYIINQDNFAKELFINGKLCLADVYNDSFASIFEVLGDRGILRVEEDALGRKYGLPRKMPRKARENLENIDGKITSQDIDNRKDLRSLPFITIDPDDAKDFDDSEYAVINDDGTITAYSVIADGSHFVKPGSALFQDVVAAGNSYYYGTKVDPMMPEKLSNDICSLNPNVDRLVMATSFTVDKDGKIIKYTIEPAIINSKHRLTYKEADYLHFGNNAPNDKSTHEGLIARAFDAKENLEAMWELSQRLNIQNKNRGVFDIESNDLKWVVDKDSTKVLGYEKEQQERFTKVIENFAVTNGIIWGDFFSRAQTPCIYRNHLPIDEERKLNNLRSLLKKYHLILPQDPTSVDYAKIIDKVKGKRYEEIVVSAILKAQNSAEYSNVNYGHLGLGVDCNNFVNYMLQKMQTPKEFVDKARENYFNESGSIYGFTVFCPDGLIPQAYCQCTSDMRRGGDLVNHVQMSSLIFDDVPWFTNKAIGGFCLDLNTAEKNSDRLEKEDNSLLASYWAKDNIGKSYLVTIIDKDPYSYKVVSEDGLRMRLPYTKLSQDEIYSNIRTKRGQDVKFYDRGLHVGDMLMVAIDGTTKDRHIRCREQESINISNFFDSLKENNSSEEVVMEIGDNK